MKNLVPYLVILALVLMCTLGVAGSAKAVKLTPAYYDYQGILAGQKIQLTIYPLKDSITGSYCGERDRQWYTLKGTLTGDQLKLNEFNAKGVQTGVFTARLSTIDELSGTWSSQKGDRKFPFSLELSSSITAEYGKRYSAAGASSDKEVEDFATALQQYIMTNQKDKVAALINYPMNVYIDGGKKAIIKNPAEFISKYDKIFYPEFKFVITQAFSRNMFCNSTGIMLGNYKNIWFSYLKVGTKSQLRIITINN